MAITNQEFLIDLFITDGLNVITRKELRCNLKLVVRL